MEAEGHIARQEALIAKLDRGGHVALIAEAKEILETLQTSLALAREHLSMELETRSPKPGNSGGARFVDGSRLRKI
jgi:hypothetical protein